MTDELAVGTQCAGSDDHNLQTGSSSMRVQVTTDNAIGADDDLIQSVQAAVEQSLGRFGDRLTRVEVHLKDVNSHKGGSNDKHCTMEARPAGMQPIAVTQAGATVNQAVSGAAKTLRITLDRTFGKLDDKRGNTPYGGEPGV